MWRVAARILIGLCGVVAIVALGGAVYQWISTRCDLAANPPPGRLVDVGGHRLHIWCTGSGEPTVILESGLGGSSIGDWSLVQPEVARFTRVCSYDRAGMGFSDPGPSPRTARRITEELVQLLGHAGIRDSVILVGASIGGLFMRVFASEHGERVVGLVLVDASHEDQEMELPPIAPLVPVLASTGAFRALGVSFGPPPSPSLPPSAQRLARVTAFRTSAYETTASEGTNLPRSATEVRATRRKLTIPVIVVTAGRDADTAWQRMQRDQVGLSTHGCQVIAEQSGHAIALSEPQAIVTPIRLLILAMRERRALPNCDELSGSAAPARSPR